jgi:hypothetical protein
MIAMFSTEQVQHQMQTRLRAENDSLRRQLTQLQADNASLSNRLAAMGNSPKLSDEQFDELLKLRGEVTRLRHQQNVPPEAAPLATNQSPAGENTSIHVGTKFVSFPTEALPALGINWMSGAHDGRVGLLTEQQYKVVNEALDGASDVYLISAPIVITANGQAASLSASKPVPVGDTIVSIGETLRVIPYFSTNSSTFNLNLNAELKQLVGDPAQPGVQSTQISNQVSLLPGQTVVLEKETPSDGWLPDATNIPAGSRSLLVFVTPAIVDSRDYIIKRGTHTERIAGMAVAPTNMDSRGFPKSQ